MVRDTSCMLELKLDQEMYSMLHDGMPRGVAMMLTRHAQANEPLNEAFRSRLHRDVAQVAQREEPVCVVNEPVNADR